MSAAKLYDNIRWFSNGFFQISIGRKENVKFSVMRNVIMFVLHLFLSIYISHEGSKIKT